MISLQNESVRNLGNFDSEIRPAVMNHLMHHYSIPEFDAEDIVQDAWVLLMEKLIVGDLPDVPKQLLAYIRNVCDKKAHEYLRKRSKDQEIEESFDDSALTAERRASVEMEVQSWADYIEECDRADQRRIDAMQEALGQLNERQRSLLNGFYLEDYSMKELAKRMGYGSERVAITTKNRIVKNLRERIQQQENANSNGHSPVALLKHLFTFSRFLHLYTELKIYTQ